MSPPPRVPWRHSLVLRLFALTLVVAAVAIAGTTWLAVHTTTRAISRQQDQALAQRERIYTTVLRYAAEHRDWSGVAQTLTPLAERAGHAVWLTSDTGRLIASSDPGADRRSATQLGVVDPVHATTARDPAGVVAGVDARIAGPYRLTSGETIELQVDVATQFECLQKFGVHAVVRTLAGGRPVIDTSGPPYSAASAECLKRAPVPFPVASERGPLHHLETAVARCAGTRAFRIAAGFRIARTASTPARVGERRLDRCLVSSRRAQLAPYAAPRAYLSVAADDVASSTTLTRSSIRRIAAVAALILLVAVAATLLIGGQMVRPLRRLTADALAQVPGGSASAPPGDEIGVLSTALREERRRRQETDDLRQAMVGDIAHELRSPLTTLRSWLEAARSGLAELDEDLVAMMLDETLHLQRILDDLRDLAAADAGTLRLHPEHTDLAAVAHQVVAARGEGAAAAGIELVERSDGAAEGLLDPVRARQIVANLVDNALAHTPRGGRVEVLAAGDDAALVLTVRDTGTGIAHEHLDRVFERFWRSDESRSRHTGGSGLGLPLVRQLAQAHGGEVGIASTPGEGTTVWVRIPQADPTGS